MSEHRVRSEALMSPTAYGILTALHGRTVELWATWKTNSARLIPVDPRSPDPVKIVHWRVFKYLHKSGYVTRIREQTPPSGSIPADVLSISLKGLTLLDAENARRDQEHQTPFENLLSYLVPPAREEAPLHVRSTDPVSNQ